MPSWPEPQGKTKVLKAALGRAPVGGRSGAHPSRPVGRMRRCAEAIPPSVVVSDAHHVACYLFEGKPAAIAA